MDLKYMHMYCDKYTEAISLATRYEFYISKLTKVKYSS